MGHSSGLSYYESPTTPPPEEEPTHDVPTFPEQDPPPGSETAIRRAGTLQDAGPGEHDSPDEGDDDVDDDDLDPQVPHSPPDGKKGRIVFDENEVAAG
jgi:hypothetical protein